MKQPNLYLKNCTEEDYAALLPESVILLGYCGSIAHGMYIDPREPEGSDDKDIMGVCFAPSDVYFGLNTFEQKVAQVREWDSVVYELKKFVRLLVGSNPNVLSLLWLDQKHYIYRDAWGELLIQNRDLFVSKAIYHSFTGYAYSQMNEMKRQVHKGYMGEKRKALVEKFGYDVKHAAHCIRLLRMGIEFLNEGVLHVQREDAPQLLEIKRGLWTLEQVQAEADHLFKRAEEAYDRSHLPNVPDRERANILLERMFRMRLVSTPKVKAFESPEEKELRELSNLWHASAVHSHDRHERMLYACRWFCKTHPEHSQTWAYKALERMLGGVYLEKRDVSNCSGF
jgi:uncharacterized protein